MKRRRFILIGALVTAGILLFQNSYLAPRSETMRGEIQSRYGLLQKYEAYLKGSGLTEREMAELIAEMKTIEKRLMSEKSEFLSSAGMQRIVAELSEKSGLSVLTMRPINAVKGGNFITVPVYFEGTGNISQISDFLHSVEKNQVMLKIDKLSINVTNMQNPKELRFKMQLSAMARI
jgi:Tfp pilus assembly protein PilO